MSGQIVLSSVVACLKFQQSIIRNQIEQIRFSYLKCESMSAREKAEFIKCTILEPRKNSGPVAVKEGPIIPGSNMTQEQIAVILAKGIYQGKPISKFQRDRFGSILYSSIKRMVYQNASRYKISCSDTVEDLSQDCFQRIIKGLNTYNPAKARVTTWVWSVCRSVLSNKYRQGLKGKNVICYVGKGVDDNQDEFGNDIVHGLSSQIDEDYKSQECSGIMSVEIVTVLRKLVRKLPERKSLIHAIFGDPDGKEFFMPTGVEISEAARIVGMEYGTAHSIYNKEIRPFLRKELKGCYTP